ncbi:hypothetical protein [uncultured Methanobrevibacter sp.]|uniref:hypothetical protein n=1 Tax=uncultured Methanobrevibacter sp. TaxID=253161 RepID=UPI0025FEDCC3|nr:hypothetical protein [uncultured Methanobrevibacter sp.]
MSINIQYPSALLGSDKTAPKEDIPPSLGCNSDTFNIRNFNIRIKKQIMSGIITCMLTC